MNLHTDNPENASPQSSPNSEGELESDGGLVVDRVSKSFTKSSKKSDLLFKDISFSVEPESLVGLIGPGGAGKSVLLKIVAGVIPQDSGQVVFTKDFDSEVSQFDSLESDFDATKASSAEDLNRRSRVGFLFQSAGLFDSMSILENTAFPFIHSPDLSKLYGREEAYERAFEALVSVGLRDASGKLPGQLSGGMRRRAGLARALVSKPKTLLLDEPTGGLDPVAAQVIIDLVLKIKEDAKASVIIISHDMRRLLPHVDKLLGLMNGGLVWSEGMDTLVEEAPKPLLDFIRTRYEL